VIAISPNIRELAPLIMKVWAEAFRTVPGRDTLVDSIAKTLAASSIGLTGVARYDSAAVEFDNAFADLTTIYDRVTEATHPYLFRDVKLFPHKLALGLIGAALLVLAFGTGYWAHPRLEATHVRYVFSIILTFAWLAMLFQPGLLRGPGLLLAVYFAATVGTTLRFVFRDVDVPEKAVEGERQRRTNEATAGVLLAFCFFLLYCAAEFVVHGKVNLPSDDGERVRVAFAVSTLALAAGLLIEDAMERLRRVLRSTLRRSADNGDGGPDVTPGS
jgi:hypothetical protein